MRQSERHLAQAVRRGNREACGKLITAYAGKLYRFFFQLTGRSQVSEDLVQETFLRVWRSLADFRGRCSLSTWIYRIAVSAFQDYLRREKRNPASRTVNSELDVLKGNSAEPLEQTSQNEELARVAEAVRKLPMDLRMPTVLRYYHSLSVRRVASACGLTCGQTKFRLKKALESLRRSLQP